MLTDGSGRFASVRQRAAGLQECGFERVSAPLRLGTCQVRLVCVFSVDFAGLVPISETFGLHEPLVQLSDGGALQGTERPLQSETTVKVLKDPHVTELVRRLVLLPCAVRVSQTSPVLQHVPELRRAQPTFIFQQHRKRICQLAPAPLVAVGLQQFCQLIATDLTGPIDVTRFGEITEHARQPGAPCRFTPRGAAHERVPRLRRGKPVLLMQTRTVHRIKNSDSERIDFAGGLFDQTGIRGGVFNRGERLRFCMDFVQQSVQSGESFHRSHCTRKQTDVRLLLCQEISSDQAIYTFRDHETTTVVVTRSLVDGYYKSGCGAEPTSEHDEDADVALFAKALAYFFVGFDARGQHRGRQLCE